MNSQPFWGKTTSSIYYSEDGDSRFVQNIGKLLLALKHIPKDCILQALVFVYWVMNIAGIVIHSLDHTTVRLTYDGIPKDRPKTGCV